MDMGWMHDKTLEYYRDPILSKHQQERIVVPFGLPISAKNVNVPLSHDEVVQCKGSLISRHAR